jgi:CheY-like chemotaxis protein
VQAESGSAALDCIAQAPRPDCVLLDLTMPEMSGLETITGMRALEAGRSLPVIGITAALVPDRAALARAGFSAVLEKPVAPARLIDAIAGALDGSRNGGG